MMSNLLKRWALVPCFTTKYKVDALPTKLARTILENFDSDTCGVKYLHCILYLTDEDVQMTFGLPKGNERIERNTRQPVN